MTNPPRPAPGNPSVLIVLLNWNSLEETRAALQSVLASDYPNLSVLLIDNGSTDGSPERLRPLASDRVHLLLNPENTGYTGGCNLGFALALERGDDFVWLLNNDAITSPGTLSSLVRLAQSDPRLGLISPRILSLQQPAEIINLGGVYAPEIPALETTNNPARAAEQARTAPDRIVVLGTALFVRTTLLRRIGPFDQRFFAYWEDSDLSVRSIRAGFRNAVDVHSAVLHSNKNYRQNPNTIKPHYWYYMARNETLFWRKHLGLGPQLLKAILWALKLNRVHLARLSGNHAAQRALVAGIWDGWLGRTGPWHPDRRALALAERLLLPSPSLPPRLRVAENTGAEA